PVRLRPARRVVVQAASRTRVRPTSQSEAPYQLSTATKYHYRIRLEEKQKLRFHYGLTERQLLKYVSISGAEDARYRQGGEPTV
ncbi:hypothetical protein KC217_22910, partial [Mycobacterium tuberculosis]|nr:hypothetical protein [Mycobacterium tuberculosis]